MDKIRKVVFDVIPQKEMQNVNLFFVREAPIQTIFDTKCYICGKKCSIAHLNCETMGLEQPIFCLISE